jgi:hypothetical protein
MGQLEYRLKFVFAKYILVFALLFFNQNFCPFSATNLAKIIRESNQRKSANFNQFAKTKWRRISREEEKGRSGGGGGGGGLSKAI